MVADPTSKSPKPSGRKDLGPRQLETRGGPSLLQQSGCEVGLYASRIATSRAAMILNSDNTSQLELVGQRTLQHQQKEEGCSRH